MEGAALRPRTSGKAARGLNSLELSSVDKKMPPEDRRDAISTANGVAVLGGGRGRIKQAASPALVGRGVVLRQQPQSACSNLCQLLLYDGNRRDVFINTVTLTMVMVTFAVASSTGSSNLGAFFWLPVTFLIAALQCIASLLTQQQGFSLVWCSLAGLMVYEQAKWQIFSRGGSELAIVAVLAAACSGFSLCYYFLEELVCDAPSDLSGLSGARLALTSCWDRMGTTMMHFTSIGLGAALGALADAAPGRAATFWALLSIAALVVVVGMPCVLRHHHRIRMGCPVSRVAAEPGPSMSAEELAIASLQSQLLKTREEMAFLRSTVGRQATHAEALRHVPSAGNDDASGIRRSGCRGNGGVSSGGGSGDGVIGSPAGGASSAESDLVIRAMEAGKDLKQSSSSIDEEQPARIVATTMVTTSEGDTVEAKLRALTRQEALILEQIAQRSMSLCVRS